MNRRPLSLKAYALRAKAAADEIGLRVAAITIGAGGDLKVEFAEPVAVSPPIGLNPVHETDEAADRVQSFLKGRRHAPA